MADNIKKLNLTGKIILKERTNNIFKYLKNSRYFFLTSLWEDPGFVLIESAFCNTVIISSNCPSGPKEFLENGKGGYLFENNSLSSLVDTMNEVFNEKESNINLKKMNAKLQSKKYSMFKHFLKLEKLLQI